jgi:hypothetical protein
VIAGRDLPGGDDYRDLVRGIITGNVPAVVA